MSKLKNQQCYTLKTEDSIIDVCDISRQSMIDFFFLNSSLHMVNSDIHDITHP